MIWSGCVDFVPDRDIPDLSSKTIIVTGGNAGLGKETVLRLAKHNPGRLYLGARSKSRADLAIGEILKAAPHAHITFLELDLSSLASVKRAAETVLANESRLDVLINNAGIMAVPAALTEDGYEIQFGTNQMGQALFTKLLMPLLSQTASQPSSDVRIINLSSGAHMITLKGGFVPEACKTNMAEFHTVRRYGHSKLANILFTKELAKRYPNITSVAVHPGRVKSNLTDKWFQGGFSVGGTLQRTLDVVIEQSVEKGALTQLWTATAKKEDVKTGSYYTPIAREGGESASAKNEKLAAKLWEWTEGEFRALGY